MRSTILALLASTAIVSASRCDQHNLDDLVARISCGTNKAISKCLHDVNVTRLGDIQDCLVSGGCLIADATAEAVWFTFDCRAGQDELKRRQDEMTIEESTTEEETTTSRATSRPTSAKTTSTRAPSSTAAVTKSESSTEPTTPTTSLETTASSTTSTSISSNSLSSTASTQSATTTSPLICSATTTKSTSKCVTSGAKTQSCVATTTEIASCASGMICFSAMAGVSSCMKRNNELTSSGLAVAIAFAIGLAATAMAVTAMVIRGKNKLKASKKSQILAAANTRSGRGSEDVEVAEAAKAFTRSSRTASEADLPLITPGGERSGQANYRQQGYFEQGQDMGRLTPPEYSGIGESGSGYRNRSRSAFPPVPRIELNQGLGALGQSPSPRY